MDKDLTLATVDRLFIAVNFEGVPGGLEDNPDKELCRYEFYEILVRMAVAKYSNIEPAEALSKLLHCLVRYSENVRRVHILRPKYIVMVAIQAGSDLDPGSG